MVSSWLKTGMCLGEPDPQAAADKILQELSDHALTLSHSRHISATKADELGIVVTKLEDDKDLQEAVLTVHHAYVQTLAETPAFKIIENHRGVGYISAVNILRP